jgi:sulfite reductase (ferredoxin)
MFYRLPPTLDAELDELEAQVRAQLAGTLDPAALKARRVPFGCYEQRRDGTYMVRIRCTGGLITPAQLRTVAELARDFGSGIVHVTTREELQIHDLELADAVPVMRALVRVGLATRGGGGNTVRNIMVSPDAGVAADEVFDPTPHALALTSLLIAESDSWVLPRKLKIAFSSSAADTGYACFNDLGFVATRQDGRPGFAVYMAGGMGAKPEVGHLVHDFVPADQVYSIAAAVKRVFDAHGNRKNKHAARLRFLWKQLGEAKLLALYEEERARLRARPPKAIDLPVVPNAAPLVDLPALVDTSPEYQRWRERYVIPQRQPGLFSVVVPAFLGNLPSGDLIALAGFLEPFGPWVLRAATGQNLRLRNIPEAALPHVRHALAAFEDPGSRLVAESVACTGADTCKLGICMSKGALRAIAKNLERSGLAVDALGDLRLNLSGCPNACGQHWLADLGFYGQVARKGQAVYPAYTIVAGAVVGAGQARLARRIDRVSARDLPSFVVDVLTRYREQKGRYPSFAAWVDAGGEAELRALADRYRNVPDFDEDKNYYFDHGASEVFSLAGKGSGECSAGLFDLIELDLRNIQRLRGELSTAGVTAARLYELTLSAARMLLITRGVEARSEVEVFDAFNSHFVGAGLVDKRFTQLLAAARSAALDALAPHADDSLALADAVERLYAGMDNSLRFSGEGAPAPVVAAAPLVASPQARAPALRRDYRAVACPMNFVKVKVDLSRLAGGDVMEVLLADGAPIDNVPRSVVAEGHRVIAQTRQGEHWSVLIEKVAARA